MSPTTQLWTFKHWVQVSEGESLRQTHLHTCFIKTDLLSLQYSEEAQHTRSSGGGVWRLSWKCGWVTESVIIAGRTFSGQLDEEADVFDFDESITVYQFAWWERRWHKQRERSAQLCERVAQIHGSCCIKWTLRQYLWSLLQSCISNLC